MEKFGVLDGCFHMEVFVTQTNEVVFLEVAARPPGNLNVLMYYETFGKNFFDLGFFIESGLNFEFGKSDLELRKSKKPTAYLMFPKMNGIVRKLHCPNIKSEFELNWGVKEGDALKSSTCNAEAAGSILFKNEDYDELKEDFETLKLFKPISYE